MSKFQEDTKFIYLDNVKIIRGFYRGFDGEVIGHNVTNNNDNFYIIDLGTRTVKISEKDLEKIK